MEIYLSETPRSFALFLFFRFFHKFVLIHFMKQLFLFGLLVCISFYSHAQKPNSEFLVSYGIGTPIAVGNFRSTNINNAKAGFAGGGLSTNFQLQYKPVNNKLGIVFGTFSNFNFFKSDDYEFEIMKLYPNDNIRVNTSTYSRNAILIGPSFTENITKNTKLEVKALMGFATCQSPEISIYNYYDGNWFLQTQNYAGSFAYELGVAVKRRVSEKFELLFDFGFLGSNPEFKSTAIYNSFGDIDYFTTNQPMNTLNLNFGFSYRLN